MKTNVNNKSRKLTLNRETIASLQTDELAGVNGGATPVFTVSLLAPPVIAGGAALVSAVGGAVASYFRCRP
jgi:lactobin A/cerein 7B family class IIb bacteriocin